MPRVKVNSISMNYDQQGTGEPLILIPYMRRSLPDLDARIAPGDRGPGRAAERRRSLVRRASGEALTPVHLRAHLEARYLESR
jgi:hypothetical protein